MVERFDECVSRDLESAAQVVPDRDAEFVAGLGKAQKSIPAVAADIAACPAADFAPRDVAADVVLRTVGVQRDLRSIQHRQQLSLVGMQPCQQAVQGDEAGATEKDAVEPSAQGIGPTPPRIELISLETGVEVPYQAAHARLRDPLLVGERVELVYQPFRVDPTQRMPPDVELPRLAIPSGFAGWNLGQVS